MPIALNGDGSVTGITAGGYPNASVNTEDLNAGTASAGQTLVAGGATGAMSWGSSIVLGTPRNSTSGTAIDFTGIPSWARRVTVIFDRVSTSGTSWHQIQIGSGSFTTSGYASQAWAGTSYSNVITTGFVVFSIASASNTFSGLVVLNLIGSNIWVSSGNLGYVNGNSYAWTSAGSSPALSGALDRVRITTVNGTDTFDAGSINIAYE